MRFHLDVGRFDDRPPFLDLGLVERRKRGGCLLLARGDHQAEVGETLAHDCIAEGVDDCDIESVNHLIGRTFGYPGPGSCRHAIMLVGYRRTGVAEATSGCSWKATGASLI